MTEAEMLKLVNAVRGLHVAELWYYINCHGVDEAADSRSEPASMDVQPHHPPDVLDDE